MGNGNVSKDHTKEFKDMFYTKEVVKSFTYYSMFYDKIILQNPKDIDNIFVKACSLGIEDVATLIYNKYQPVVTENINFYVMFYGMKKLFYLFVNSRPPETKIVKITDQKHFSRIQSNARIMIYSLFFYDFNISIKTNIESREDLRFLINMSQKNRDVFKNVYVNHKQLLKHLVANSDWICVLYYLKIYLEDETATILIDPVYENYSTLIDKIKNVKNANVANWFELILISKLSEPLYKYILNYTLYD